jgi:hypothetical protein
VAKVGNSNPDRTISLEGCSAQVKKNNNNITCSKFKERFGAQLDRPQGHYKTNYWSEAIVPCLL